MDKLRQDERYLGGRLSEAGRPVLGEMIGQLASNAADPANMRLAIAEHRALREQQEKDASVAAARGQVERATSGAGDGEVDPDVAAARELLAGLRISGKREANGNTPSVSPEQRETSPLNEKVVKAAKGTAIIHTDTPGELPRYYRDSSEKRFGRGTGFQTFGDGSSGSSREIPHHFLSSVGGRNLVMSENPNGDYVRDMVEAVAFSPAVKDVYETRTRTVKGGLFRRDQSYDHSVKVGEEPQMVINSDGKQEPGVYFDYAYNPSLAGGEGTSRRMGLPVFRESSGGRDGNILIVRTLIPESLAAELRAAIEENPQIARQVAENVVLELGGISREAWEDGVALSTSNHSNRQKPPYEGLPPEHRLFILDRQTDQHGRQVMVAHKIDKPVR